MIVAFHTSVIKERNHSMKKVISTMGIFIVLLLLYCAPALAATITITTEPTEITSAGYITVRFSVANDSSNNMTDMRIRGFGISDTDNSLSGHRLGPSEEIRFSTQNVNVPADKLGTYVVYTFYWMEGGEQKSRETTLMLGSATAPPAAVDMTGSRTASKSTGRQGDKITLTYTLKNPGAVQMTDVTIRDTLAGDSAVKSGFSIEAGGTASATYEYTLGTQDVVSEPTITYKLNGESKTLRLDKLTLAVVNLKLTNTVTMGDPTQEGVLFTVVIKNDGNQTVKSISVKDDQGNAVNADSFTLQPGQEQLLSYTVSASTTRVVSFTITGKDEAGQPYEDKTNSFEVRPYVDPSSVSFQLFTHILENLDENGNMKIRFTIQNSSSVELNGAVVTEKLLGEVIPSMGILPPGETVKEVNLKVGEPRELEFTVTAKDTSGAEHTYSSTLTAAVVAIATPAPTTAPQEEEPAPQSGGMSGTLITVLIVLAILMAVAGIALLILSIYERKRNAEMDALDADGYARGPRAQGGAAAVPPAEKRVKHKVKKQKKYDDDDDYFDEDDDLPPRYAVNNMDAPPQLEARRVQERPVSQQNNDRPEPKQTAAHSYVAPAVAPAVAPVQEQRRQPKPLDSSPAQQNYRRPLSSVAPTPPPAPPVGNTQTMPPMQTPPQRPKPLIKPEPLKKESYREPMYNEPVYNELVYDEPARTSQPDPRYAQQYEVPSYEDTPAYSPEQAFEPAPLYEEFSQFSQPPQYTPPPAPPTMDWPEQEAERPRQAVEPPIQQPPVIPPMPTYDDYAGGENTQKPSAQASLGVRNRIHRVRPIDDNKN